MGMARDDVTLTAWLKQPGDQVSAGEPVALVETAKAELEVSADADGVLGRQLIAANDRVAPGTTITRILADGENEPAETAEMNETAEAADKVPPSARPTQASAPAASERAPHTLSPRARRERAEADAAELKQPSAPNHPPVEAAPTPNLDPFRTAIADSVSRSWREIPHFAVTRELTMDAAVRALADWKAVLPRLTLTDLLLRALALALMEREETSRLDVGLAVATEKGVAIPVVADVLSLDLPGLVAARRGAVERAQVGRLNADDARTPATTLSNLGAVGVDQFTGVVPYGQTSMLTVGRAAPRPVVRDGELAVATTMTATLNVDHRTWDGMHAGLLLQRLAAVLDRPASVLTPTPPITETR